MDDATTGEFDEVSTSTYSVLAYLIIGSAGLWAFFRAHSVPLSVAEVRYGNLRDMLSKCFAVFFTACA